MSELIEKNKSEAENFLFRVRRLIARYRGEHHDIPFYNANAVSCDLKRLISEYEAIINQNNIKMAHGGTVKPDLKDNVYFKHPVDNFNYETDYMVEEIPEENGISSETKKELKELIKKYAEKVAHFHCMKKTGSFEAVEKVVDSVNRNSETLNKFIDSL